MASCRGWPQPFERKAFEAKDRTATLIDAARSVGSRRYRVSFDLPRRHHGRLGNRITDAKRRRFAQEQHWHRGRCDSAPFVVRIKETGNEIEDIS